MWTREDDQERTVMMQPDRELTPDVWYIQRLRVNRKPRD